jgi:hypothetical protein
VTIGLGFRLRVLPLGFVVWDELFLGMTGASWSKKGFDQNRLFVGPAVFAFEGIFRVEVGYPFNYLSRTPNRIPHILALNLFVSVRKNGDGGARASRHPDQRYPASRSANR